MRRDSRRTSNFLCSPPIFVSINGQETRNDTDDRSPLSRCDSGCGGLLFANSLHQSVPSRRNDRGGAGMLARSQPRTRFVVFGYEDASAALGFHGPSGQPQSLGAFAHPGFTAALLGKLEFLCFYAGTF